uniref:Reverse transcriptase domain-containing protein n=1 Tax=Heliothis virescens TaxID=7102 RepID=A0A2A4K2S2_HELVI
MVLLSPSIGALRHLLEICERYAVAQGLKYNAKKSELLVFRSRGKCYSNVPQVTISGTPLNRVTQFKYLGHWVTEDLNDDLDIERERRALAIRSNMLIRRFARCSKKVKMTLFRAYCQSFYTCSLWVSYTQRTYNALRVQYNNAFRMLVGLPRSCSASGMFAKARIDGFHAIIRKRCASILRRMRDSSHSMLSTLCGRWDCPWMRHWIERHASADVSYILRG